jgi:uncharacterized protein (TIGR02118 family)
MEVCLFITFEAPDRALGVSSGTLPAATPATNAETAPAALSLDALAALAEPLRHVTGWAGLCVHRPSQADDPYLKDTDAPWLVLQLYFDSLKALEAQLEPGAVLHGLLTGAAPSPLPALSLSAGTQQVMSVERIDIATAAEGAAAGPLQCTYLVAYEGSTPDVDEWHAHYRGNHVPLMVRLPGLRELELYRPLEWAGGLPLPRASAMQRNKVVFDNPAALTAALNSPVRHEMRADHEKSPPFTGRSTHYPMLTLKWVA